MRKNVCQAQFRFYAELNDFLPSAKKYCEFSHAFFPKASVKDIIEAIGVPHPEIDLIIVNGQSVDFNFQIQENDLVSVYPTFESIDISPIIRLRAKPLRKTKFILDVHLGKLARYLRLLGFDVIYETDFADAEIIKLALTTKRIILTRDKGLLKNKIVTHGYWLRQTNPKLQAAEILNRFDLYKSSNPFNRCLECNALLQPVPKNQIINKIPLKTQRFYEVFYQCSQCTRIYWQGSHYTKLKKIINDLLHDK